MTVEWLITGLLLAGVLLSLGRRLRSTQWWLTLGVLYGLSMSAVAWRSNQVRQKQESATRLAEKVPRSARPGGYVSSDNCKSCHPGPYDSWHRSFHRTMTQLPSREAVRGKFDHVTLKLGGDTYRLEQQGDDYWAEMVDPDWEYTRRGKRATYREGSSSARPTEEVNARRVRKRISMLTGSHHMQAHWVASEFGNMQFSFPFTYLFEEQRWVPRNDVFLFDPKIRFSHQVWNTGCISCHATGGQPRQDVQTRLMQTRVGELGIA